MGLYRITQKSNRRLFSAMILGSLLIIGSCATPPRQIPSQHRIGSLATTFDLYGKRGSMDAEVFSLSFSSEFGCRLKVDVYTPVALQPGNPDFSSSSLIILAHGFLQSMDRMRGWADHFASWGMTTAVVSFCNSSPFNGRHDRNAQDLIQVSRRAAELLGISISEVQVWYGGFSAGGLSALLATAMDDRSFGYLGLDPVNSGNLAAKSLPLEKPGLFLFAEPSSCNAQGNMVEPIVATIEPSQPVQWVETIEFDQLLTFHERGDEPEIVLDLDKSLMVSIRFATHCDFEFPTTSFCERLCGKNVPLEAELEIRRSIVALATWWMVSQFNQ